MIEKLSLILYGLCLGVVFGPAITRLLQRAMRPLRCKLKACPCRRMETDYGISGQCIDCGKIVAFVSREKIRAYAARRDAEEQRDAKL
jgi:hypothetical protein